jgi:hypothetical protein
MGALFEDGPRRLKHVTNKKGVGGRVLLTLMLLHFDVFFIYGIVIMAHCGSWTNLKLKKFDFFNLILVDRSVRELLLCGQKLNRKNYIAIWKWISVMYLRYMYLKFKYACNYCLQKYSLGLSIIYKNVPFACAVATKTCIDICREQRTFPWPLKCFDTHNSSHRERVGL